MDTRRFCAVAISGALAAAPAWAGEMWDGGSPSNSNWSSPNNWNPNGVPANDGSADLVFQGSVRRSPVMDADWWVRSIAFSASAGAFSISGSGHKLSIGAGGLSNSDADSQSIAVESLQLTANQTWSAASGPLRVAIASYLYHSGNDLTIDGAFDTLIDGDGNTNGGKTIIKEGEGTLTINLDLINQNLTINNGVVKLGGSVNVGAGISTVWHVGLGATLELPNTTAYVGQLTGHGQVTNNDQQLLLGGDDSSSTLGANISGEGRITKHGAGTITLGSTFGSSCPELLVREGKLISNGRINNAAVAVEVDTSAWLDLGSSDEMFGSLAGNGFVDLNAQRLTLSGNSMVGKCTGIITGVGGSLRLNGQNARLNLASANDYSGGTVIRSPIASQPATLLANNASGSATGAGAVEVKVGGILGGDGAVSGAVTVENQAQIAPGGSESLAVDAGSLALAGACTFQAGSSLAIEIGGATAGTQFDQLNVGGAATLNGTLVVRLISGFKPSHGQGFEFLKFGSRSGTFAALDAPPGFSVVYSVALKNASLRYSACPGDTDGNKTVNQDDIDTVLFNYGRSVPAGMNGDLDFDGDVDQDDIDAVLFYYGSSC